jgi:tetratricopeptide (TPR) repeat protein
LRKDYAPAGKMLQTSEGWLMKKPGHNEFFMAHLYYAYGNLAYQKKDFKRALKDYEQCRDLCNKLAPLHPQTASAYYKLGCVEHVRRNGERALMFLDKAYNITDLRSPGQLDGTKARILRKRGEVLLDDVIRQKEGLNLKTKMEDDYRTLADKIGLHVDPEDVGTDEAFDLLVPGYFR